jgi:hypothetical protein
MFVFYIFFETVEIFGSLQLATQNPRNRLLTSLKLAYFLERAAARVFIFYKLHLQQQ